MMLDQLEAIHGKAALWDWTREWLELESESDEPSEHMELGEYLYQRAGRER